MEPKALGLFREEAIRSRSVRIYGEVFGGAPQTLYRLSGLLIASIAVLGIFVTVHASGFREPLVGVVVGLRDRTPRDATLILVRLPNRHETVPNLHLGQIVQAKPLGTYRIDTETPDLRVVSLEAILPAASNGNRRSGTDRVVTLEMLPHLFAPRSSNRAHFVTGSRIVISGERETFFSWLREAKLTSH